MGRNQNKPPPGEDFLAGGGEMGERVRAFPWANNPIGPTSEWPQSLRSALSICLNSGFPIALYWGTELRLLYNDEWSPILGGKHPWALGKTARETWPEIWDIIEPLFRQVMTTGEATRSRDQLLPMRRYGFVEECYFDYTFTPIRGETGKVDGIFNAVLETTTRVIGERRLGVLRKLAAYATDEATTIETACEVATKCLAEDPQDLPFAFIYTFCGDESAKLIATSGTTTPDLTPPIITLSEADQLWPLRTVIETGKSVVVDDLSSKFGPIPGSAWPEPVDRAVVLPLATPGHSDLAGFVVAGISPRLALTDDYRAFLELTAGHVAASIANARALVEKKRRAEALAELDRAKTAFFSNISHEFRTPLTLMLGPIEDLLAREQTNPFSEIAEPLDMVNRNGLRLLRLVNSLLDFSRIEAGRVRAVFQSTDLATFTADLASSFRAACERAGLRLRVDCPPIGEDVFVDREMWEKVVLNLISNAFKFTFQGEIGIALHRTGNTVELSVSDTGTGIPENEVHRLFERFHRIENARGRTHEGSGIGLALVQELVRLHSGTVAVESVVGAGSTFTVSLPLGHSHLPAEQIRDTRTSSTSGAGALPYVEEALRWLPNAEPNLVPESQPLADSLSASWSTEHVDDTRPLVLVADDNADLRQYIARLLGTQFHVQVVPDGEAALLAVHTRAPDLVLTDVMMPRLDGFGLLNALRADPSTRHLPVIMLSARAGEESRVEGMEAGADDYLIKPFSARELIARVTAHVQMARLRRESERALRERDERLRMALTAAHMVAWQYNPATGDVEISANAREVFGLLPGTKLENIEQGYSLLHPEDVDRHRTVMQQAITNSGEYVSEYRLVRQDTDEIIWLEERGHAVCDAPGEPLRLVGVVADITARKHSEELLKSSEQRFRRMADAVPVLIWISDTSKRCTWFNKSWLDFSGRPMTSLVGYGWADALHPDDFDRCLSVYNAHFDAREPFSMEYRIKRHDGEYRWMLDRGIPWFDTEDSFSGFIDSCVDITDRKLAEHQLEQERDRLRVTFASIGDAVLTTDTKGQVTSMNAVAEALTGWTIDQARGEPLETVFRIVNESTRTTVESPAVRALRDGVIVGLANHTVLIARDGTERPIDDSAAPIRSQEGDLIGCVLVFRDVTKRREDEKALSESELRYRLVGNAANDAIWDWDLITDDVVWNEGVQRAFGYAAQDVGLKADWWIDHIHPDDRDRIAEHIHAAIDGSVEFWKNDYRFRRADGSYAYIFDRGQIVRQDGKPIRMVGSMLDLTERKRAEAALSAAEERFAFVRKSSGVGFWYCDLPFDVLQWDEQVKAHFHLAPDARVTIETFYERIHPADREPTRSAIERNIGEQVPYDVVYRTINPDNGTIKWIRAIGRTFHEPDNTPIRFDGVTVDVSEQKRAEAELREVAAALSEAGHRKDEFLATLAHELRNPLAPLRNALELMRLSNKEDVQEHARSVMERQLSQMVRLVDDLMDVSRITRGQVDLRKEHIPLSVVINSAVETSRPLIEQMGHQLTVTMASTPIVLDADVTRLAQVFSNLLNNAAKYSDRGGHIHVSIERQDDGAVVSVRDTGIGIAADHLAHIFEMFTQVDRSLERSQGGLGIGLTLVRRLVEMHGGQVDAISEGLGRGSEFIVRLPIVIEASDAKVDKVPEPASPKSSLRILVVDDNRDGANSLTMMLKFIGNETHTAYDGEEAVELAEKYRPDVILFDIGLPKLNGFEACRMIREQPWGKTPIIIALTGWGQEEDRRRSHEAGFDHHLVKPVDPRALMQLLAAFKIHDRS